MRELGLKSAVIWLYLACLFIGCSSRLQYDQFEAGNANYPPGNKAVSFHSCNRDDHRAEAEALIKLHQQGKLIGSTVEKDSTIGGVKLGTANQVILDTQIAEYEWHYMGTKWPWALSVRVHLPDRTVRRVKLRIDD